MLQPSTLIQQRYEIVRAIGQGGGGAVYEATDLRLRSRVALKELLLPDPQARKAFEREAQLLGNLRHPSLPRVLDHFADGHGQFLVMDYIAGDDLAAQLQQGRGPFPLADVLRWADQLLGALEYLHSQSPPIFHRDIKPGNLKLSAGGDLMLLDFGLAKGSVATQHLSSLNSIRGYTPQYAPLEQIQGTGTSERSDLFAVAATVYHLLTGQAAPDALTRAAAVLSRSPDPLQTASALNPAVPMPIAAAINETLSLDPNDRPASASAMREYFRQAPSAAAAAQPTKALAPPSAPTVPISAPLPAPAARKRWLQFGGLAALIGVIALAAVIALPKGEQAAPPTQTPAQAAIQPTATAAQSGAPPPAATATSPPTAAPSAPTAAPTAAPLPAGPADKTIVIGMTQYPDTLFGIESQSSATTQVLAAIQPACITSLSYEYQPVCFTKLPSFANGDAVTRTVTIDSSYQGSVVVNDELITDIATLALPVEMEQLVVTWRLIDGLKWEDGTPLTAKDFEFAAELYNEPDIQNASRFLLERSESWKAVDDKTITWTGVPGYADTTYFLNILGPEPEHVLGAMQPGDIGVGDYANHPLAYGPYKVVENIPQESTTLVVNEHYWRAAEGLPKVGNVVYKYLTSEDQVLQQLEGNEIDVVGSIGLTLANTPKLDELEQAGAVKAQYVPATIWEHMDFAVERGDGVATPFGDAKVRQAVAYAIDRQEINDTVLFGKSVVMNSFLPQDHWAYPPDGAGLEPYAFDPAKAKALLAEAGWRLGADGILAKDGIPFKVEFYTTENNRTRQSVAQMIQEDLRAVGIEVTLTFVPSTTTRSSFGDGVLSPRKFDLALYAWVSGPVPSVSLYLCDQIPTPANTYDGQNNPGWCDPAYDKTVLAAQAETDRAKRLSLLIEAQRIWNAQLPSLPLYQRVNLGAARAEVTGLRLDPTSTVDFWNIETWDIGE